jgi:uncharacterized protein (TIGR02391 family)
MDALNLLTILDVLLDIKHEIDFNQGSVKVPILAPAIRFRDLLPVDTIPARDFYLKNRWSSFKFLAEQQVVAGLKWKQGPHRWQSHVELTPNRPTLMDLLEKVQVEIKVRSQQDEAKPAGKSQANFWDILHPKVVELAIPRFMAGHFSDAVEACLKEINAMVKARAKERTGKEFDGADLMRNTFSPKNPIITLADLSTESGKNEQQGYMEIFAGTMTGIRNPKAHDNVVIDEKRTIHLLHLASLLMYKLDEAK